MARHLFCAAAAVAVTACLESTHPPTAPPEVALHSGHSASIDVEGNWTWMRTDLLTFPDWVAAVVFGVEPEGPVTGATCEAAGSMSLTQSGASLAGTSTTSAQQCTTSGGQVFTDPGAFAPQSVSGVLTGRSMRLELVGAAVSCAYHAVASQISGGTAHALNGGGPCIVPGHPQSAIPAPPPPGGTSKTLTWTALRS
jgi:hypothetical protein